MIPTLLSLLFAPVASEATATPTTLVVVIFVATAGNGALLQLFKRVFWSRDSNQNYSFKTNQEIEETNAINLII